MEGKRSTHHEKQTENRDVGVGNSAECKGARDEVMVVRMAARTRYYKCLLDDGRELGPRLGSFLDASGRQDLGREPPQDGMDAAEENGVRLTRRISQASEPRQGRIGVDPCGCAINLCNVDLHV